MNLNDNKLKGEYRLYNYKDPYGKCVNQNA